MSNTLSSACTSPHSRYECQARRVCKRRVRRTSAHAGLTHEGKSERYSSADVSVCSSQSQTYQ